jgi:hypothetical protein
MSYKRTLLAGLSQIDHPKSDHHLAGELCKHEQVVLSSSNYLEISDSLRAVEAIAPRLHKQAIELYSSFLSRLETLEFTYTEEHGVSEAQFAKYYNRERMLAEVLEDLESLRYLEAEKVLDILIQYSVYDDERVREKALNGLKRLSEYHITALERMGFAVQAFILEKLESMSIQDRVSHFDAVQTLCGNLLSASMSRSSSDYKTVTWHTAEIPPNDALKDIRQRTLALLEGLFLESTETAQQKSILSLLQGVRQTYHGQSTDEFHAMATEDTKSVLRFLLQVIESNTDLPVLQKIEHDVWWMDYHYGASAEENHKLAREIRAKLLNHPEYKFFRIFIGYESIFEDLESGERLEHTEAQKVRDAELEKLFNEVTPENFPEWEQRLRSYASLELNDLAAFPGLDKFLRWLGEKMPDLAFQLVQDAEEGEHRVLVSTLLGLLQAQPERTLEMIHSWLAEEKHHLSIAIMFDIGGQPDLESIKMLMAKAIRDNDMNVLSRFIPMMAEFSVDDVWLNEIFVPTLEHLTKLKNTDWIYSFWYRQGKNDLLSKLSKEQMQLVLSNLEYLEKIDYHSEETLGFIAERYPAMVVEFFGNRLRNSSLDGTFDAVPFNFHSLQNQLSEHADVVIQTIYGWRDKKEGLYKFDGPRLFSIIFPALTSDVQNKLIALVKSGENKSISFVLAIMRNYHGEEFVHSICKVVVEVLPDNDKLLNEVRIALMSTGVVSGEFGMAEAYEERKQLVEKWLEGEDSKKVKKFAKDFLEGITKQVEHEYARANEELELMKFRYGDEEGE